MTEGAGGPCHLHHGSGYAQPHESPPASRKCNRWNPAACNLADGAHPSTSMPRSDRYRQRPVLPHPVHADQLVPGAPFLAPVPPLHSSLVGSSTRVDGRADQGQSGGAPHSTSESWQEASHALEAESLATLGK